MPSPLSPNLYNLLRIHLEKGIPIERLNFSSSQKQRLMQCEEAFKIFVQRPWMDLRAYFSNRWGHSSAEINNDIAVINFMAEFVNKGTRAIDEMKVRATANKAIADGAQSGNAELSLKGATLLAKVAKLDKPEADVDTSTLLAGMPIVITSDPSKKYKNKRVVSDKEMKRIRDYWGVKQDPWQEMTELKEDEDGNFISVNDKQQQ